MSKRKAVSDSVRWAVFARDNFTCRYCGRQAGQNGVTLAADHVISVADGGDNRMDNLVTSCRQCNGGKSARSLDAAPATPDVLARIEERAKANEALAESMRAAIEAEKAIDQSIINLKCDAYNTERTELANNELAIVRNLLREFGSDVVAEWYRCAFNRGVYESRAIKYVCGCARIQRETAQ